MRWSTQTQTRWLHITHGIMHMRIIKYMNQKYVVPYITKVLPNAIIKNFVLGAKYFDSSILELKHIEAATGGVL